MADGEVDVDMAMDRMWTQTHVTLTLRIGCSTVGATSPIAAPLIEMLSGTAAVQQCSNDARKRERGLQNS